MQRDVINGFSLCFSGKLLKKLKKIRSEGKIFKGEDDCGITKITSSVLAHLAQQMKGELQDLIESQMQIITTDEIDEVISTTEEFLAIFKEKR